MNQPPNMYAFANADVRFAQGEVVLCARTGDYGWLNHYG